ncbi:hypothetical protein AAHC03_05355 [Spirometra sp. Aus1]
MPLILLCGYPCSGKSTVTALLAGCLRAQRPDYQIEVVSEESIAGAPSGGTAVDPRVAIYTDANLEKQLHAEIKSQAKRALTGKKPSNTIVIVDANNYIKGYRYELYCTAKSMRHKQAILHCTTGLDKCREINTKLGRYPETVFSEVVTRFERPNPSSRWDTPLYEVCLSEDFEQEKEGYSQNLQTVIDQLTARILSELSSGARVRPNQSTVPAQAADSSYLQIVDKATTEVVSAILAAQANGAAFASLPPHLTSPDSGDAPNLDLTDGFAWTASTLAKAKRQYLSFLRTNAAQLTSATKRTTPFEAAVLFMHFLNSEAQRSTFLA